MFSSCITDEKFLISPIQIGIPNNRTRLYMICERSSRFEGYDRVVINVPELELQTEEGEAKGVVGGEKGDGSSDEMRGSIRDAEGAGMRTGEGVAAAERQKVKVRTLSHYLQTDLGAEEESKLLISRDRLTKPYMKVRNCIRVVVANVAIGCVRRLVRAQKHTQMHWQGNRWRKSCLTCSLDHHHHRHHHHHHHHHNYHYPHHHHYHQGMSIVGPFNSTTICFTASYSKTYHKSSGMRGV